jgi:adenosylcobinamide-GDP ribazoletransferase
LTRGSLPALLVFTHSARRSGMAAWVKASGTPQAALIAALLALVLAGVLLQARVVPAAALVVTVTLLVRAWANRSLGGVSGDVCGAAQQLGEVAALVYLSAPIGG